MLQTCLLRYSTEIRCRELELTDTGINHRKRSLKLLLKLAIIERICRNLLMQIEENLVRFGWHKAVFSVGWGETTIPFWASCMWLLRQFESWICKYVHSVGHCSQICTVSLLTDLEALLWNHDFKIWELPKKCIKLILSEVKLFYSNVDVYIRKCKQVLPLRQIFILNNLIFLYKIINELAWIHHPGYLKCFDGCTHLRKNTFRS